MVEAQLSLLLNVGLLTRHTASRDRYLFAMPNAGPLVRAIIAGRKVTVHLMPALKLLTLLGVALHAWCSMLVPHARGLQTVCLVPLIPLDLSSPVVMPACMGLSTLHLRVYIPYIPSCLLLPF